MSGRADPLVIAAALGLLVSLLDLPVPGPVSAPVEPAADLAVPAMLLAFGLSSVDARAPGRGEDAPLLFGVVALKSGRRRPPPAVRFA